MGKGRSGRGGIGAALLYKKEQQEKRRAIQDAATAEDRERIEAGHEGREAFADSGRWGHLDQHGRSVEEVQIDPKPGKEVTFTGDPSDYKEWKKDPQAYRYRKKNKRFRTDKTTNMTGGGQKGGPNVGDTSGGNVNL
tara:strand:- start:139 stop:549 length:411 start_codon:yes stop_codon:yes gene_type:complete